MQKEQLERLHNLSRKEKFEIVHFLWDDIAKEQNDISIPTEHQKIINDRLEKIKSGNAKFKSWEEIKAKYV